MSTTAAWHKSSYSANGANCVEVSEGQVTGIRDTQNREAGHLSVSGAEWTALLGAVASTE
ncbi:DUF397 domain-containing protein [Nocardiopsis exhalans]|uniref:DUF397 domain-containing protein n=1 Tax=Nocardiopsis exhalans TaxID=163604 RepID=A0ABY5DGA1_9ACTN|nr:DUF397 domain-containing protein [Nocardiopsis exhalans]USY22375.1 DUF397 domain-containing protein [Nocardiopsis exhalans]